jgi:anti-sigma factor RsiW
MKDAHSTERGAVSDSGIHLSDLTLEQFAEGQLPQAEHREASLHLESCTRCASVVDGYHALFSALSDLPRFAPSPGFSDAVIARTRLTPEPGPVVLWLRQFMPKTRRGWALLGAVIVAPALPMLAALVWLLTHPLLTPASLWHWVTMQGSNAGASTGVVALRWATDSGVAGLMRGAYDAARALPLEAVTVLATLLAIAIPLSVWAIVRLVRTPMKDVTYAN